MKVESTAVTNLVRNAESGIYYARVKQRGKIVWKSLETDVFSVAKLRLPDKVKEIRKLAPLGADMSASMKFEDAVAIYKGRAQSGDYFITGDYRRIRVHDPKNTVCEPARKLRHSRAGLAILSSVF